MDSLNHHEPEGYERIMKLPWQKTRAKLDLLHEAKAAGRFPRPVIVSRVCDGSEDDKAFEPWGARNLPVIPAETRPANELARPSCPACAFPRSSPGSLRSLV